MPELHDHRDCRDQGLTSSSPPSQCHVQPATARGIWELPLLTPCNWTSVVHKLVLIPAPVRRAVLCSGHWLMQTQNWSKFREHKGRWNRRNVRVRVGRGCAQLSSGANMAVCAHQFMATVLLRTWASQFTFQYGWGKGSQRLAHHWGDIGNQCVSGEGQCVAPGRRAMIQWIALHPCAYGQH